MKKNKHMPRRSFASRYTMMVALVFFSFVVLVLALMLGAILTMLAIIKLDLGVNNNPEQTFPFFIISMVLGSMVTGIIISIILGKHPLKPFRVLISATQEIAAGNFDVRVNLRGPMELKQLAVNFNHMAEELAGIETLRSDFVSNVSHEFKTPIVSIRGFAQLMQAEELSREEQLEYLDIIVKESARLSQLAENVLILSGLEKLEKLEAKHLAPYSLDEQLRQAILLLEPQWSKKELQFQMELAPVTLHGNEELIQQVWLNLLGNAIKFTPPGGLITVSTSELSDTEELAVTISDTGIGMDEQTLQRLFDKFYQADKSHSTEGNGLGLSLVKRILDLCGGSIAVDSAPGSGSSFKVLLPAGTAS